jgi:hypothetical protein
MRLVENKSTGNTYAETAPPHPCQGAEAAIGSYYSANLRITYFVWEYKLLKFRVAMRNMRD